MAIQCGILSRSIGCAPMSRFPASNSGPANDASAGLLVSSSRDWSRAAYKPNDSSLPSFLANANEAYPTSQANVAREYSSSKDQKMNNRIHRVSRHAIAKYFSAAFLAIILLWSGGLTNAQSLVEYLPAKLWSEPIEDALRIGEQSFPDGFNRGISTLQVFDGRLWFGYGDSAKNLGSVTPVEFRYFSRKSARVIADGQGAAQRSPSDTGEEQIEPFRVCFGQLCQPGVDSNSDDETWTQAKGPAHVIEGNFFSLVDTTDGPVWQKYRSIPGGEHVHDLAEYQNAIYAVGSGADNRAEFESGQIFRYLWKSTDRGKTFSTVHRVMYPEIGKGDTRFRRLLVAGNCLYVFGYINPFVEGGPRQGCHMKMVGDKLTDVDGDIAKLYVARTYSIDREQGLVLTRTEEGSTRIFQARETGFRELTEWQHLRVIDIAIEGTTNALLVLASQAANPDSFTIYQTERTDPAKIAPVIDLGREPSTAVAWWNGSVYIGTANGKIMKSEIEKN
jgi:hypothetical protein